MKPVDRSEILDLGPYEQIREHFRNRVIALKKQRRVFLGDHMSLVFENHDIALLQIQEMLRTERITNEAAIAHEINTYNELLPGPGELTATLFIEYTDADERKVMLSQLHDLANHLHLKIGDRTLTAKFMLQFGEEAGRLPAVNYVRFTLDATDIAALRTPSVAVALESSHMHYRARSVLTEAARAQLVDDLSEPAILG
jgi:hypothetical protein